MAEFAHPESAASAPEDYRWLYKYRPPPPGIALRQPRRAAAIASLIYTPDVDPQQPSIFYADDVHEDRARFTLLHEPGLPGVLALRL